MELMKWNYVLFKKKNWGDSFDKKTVPNLTFLVFDVFDNLFRYRTIVVLLVVFTNIASLSFRSYNRSTNFSS